jgi:putative acetyltransferase
VVDDLSGPQIAEFLHEHVRQMRSITPLESKHALDLDALRGPEVTFWSVMDGDSVVGCGAIKRLDAVHAELKSMRTATARKRSGIAARPLSHIHRGQGDGVHPAEPGDRLGRVLPSGEEAV